MRTTSTATAEEEEEEEEEEESAARLALPEAQARRAREAIAGRRGAEVTGGPTVRLVHLVPVVREDRRGAKATKAIPAIKALPAIKARQESAARKESEDERGSQNKQHESDVRHGMRNTKNVDVTVHNVNLSIRVHSRMKAAALLPPLLERALPPWRAIR